MGAECVVAEGILPAGAVAGPLLILKQGDCAAEQARVRGRRCGGAGALPALIWIGQQGSAVSLLPAGAGGEGKGRSAGGVQTFMHAQAKGIAEGVSAVLIPADKRLVSGMREQMSVEGTALQKFFVAIAPGAGKVFFATVAAQVSMECVAIPEGFGTSRPGADKGTLPGMGSFVQEQGGRAGKGLPTALNRADTGTLPGMDPQVSDHFGSAAGPYLAAGKGAGKRPPDAAAAWFFGQDSSSTAAARVPDRRSPGGRQWCKAVCHKVLYGDGLLHGGHFRASGQGPCWTALAHG